MNISSAASNVSSYAQPRVLFVDTTRRAVGARLPLAFSRLECRIGTVCPAHGHPARALASRIETFIYRPLRPLQSIRDAMLSFDPCIVVPVCERAVEHLHRLHAWACENSFPQIVACIERSLGPAESYAIVASRFKLLSTAAEEGILVPAMIDLRNAEDLRTGNSAAGFPWVIKADGSSGGLGIEIAENVGAAEQFIARHQRRARTSTFLRRLCTSRDRPAVVAEWRRLPGPMMAQAWIAGRPANCSVVCWQGEVLAAISVEVLATSGRNGPASLVEIVDGHNMLKAARRLAARLRLSGFFGLDFMIESATRNTYLIEMNPRCTPSAAFELGTGRNLPAALWARLTGRPEPHTDPMTAKKTVAIFPQVPESYGRTSDGYYDVPVDSPELAYALLHPWRLHSWFGEGLLRLRKMKSSPDGARLNQERTAPRQIEGRA